MKKKNITGLLVTIAVFAAVISLSIYFFSNSEPTYLQGQVEAKQINVAPKVPGRVKAIYKQEGDAVHKGDLLLELESTELDAKLSQAEAARLRKPKATKPSVVPAQNKYKAPTMYGNKPKPPLNWPRKLISV